MKPRYLAALPLVIVGLYWLAVLATHGSASLLTVEVPLMKFVACAGCIAAAARYRRADYLFWAWTLLSLNYGMLGTNDLLLGRRLHLLNVEPTLAATLRTWVVVVANVAAAVSAIMMARTWRVAGLGLPSRAWHKAVVILGVCGALALVTILTLPAFKSLSWSSMRGVGAIASNFGDFLCFSVIAPLFLQAVALRGGTLVWPWALITASDVSWMLFDTMLRFGTFDKTRIVSETFRCAACACALAAGLAQRWATRSNAPT